jgi:AcrR family transcriptional regulator
VQPRSELVLDAAIQVVGEEGIRALTHRAVDAAAGLPAGSTSNLFRTREALLRGIARRMVDVELVSWNQLAGAARPSTVDELATVLGQTVAMLVGPLRTLTVARFALFVEAARDADLQAELDRAATRVAAIGIEWLTVVGSSAPAEHTAILMAYLDGLLLHELAFPRRTAGAGDLLSRPGLRLLLRTLLGA